MISAATKQEELTSLVRRSWQLIQVDANEELDARRRRKARQVADRLHNVWFHRRTLVMVAGIILFQE